MIYKIYEKCVGAHNGVECIVIQYKDATGRSWFETNVSPTLHENVVDLTNK